MYALNSTVTKVKKQHREQEKIAVHHIDDKGLASGIQQRDKYPALKWATDLRGRVCREDARISTWEDGPVTSPHREANESTVTCEPTLGWDVCNGKDGVGRECVQDTAGGAAR